MKNKFLFLILSLGILLPVIKSVAQSDKGRVDDLGFRKYRFSDTNVAVYKLGEKIYYNFKKEGMYDIQLTVVNENGISHSTNQSIEIKPKLQSKIGEKSTGSLEDIKEF